MRKQWPSPTTRRTSRIEQERTLATVHEAKLLAVDTAGRTAGFERATAPDFGSVRQLKEMQALDRLAIEL